MVILANQETKLLVQGITGRQGAFHTRIMLDYGTKIVAGVTPNKAGQQIEGIPVYNSVTQAGENHEFDASIAFVPSQTVLQAGLEAIQSGAIRLLVIISEMMPIQDSLILRDLARKNKVTLIGPNTPGLISPGRTKIGIMPSYIFKPGDVGIVSRSGTLMYEIASTLSSNGIGQSTCVGVGGDRIVGTKMLDVFRKFEGDPETSAIVLIGEIGGSMEEEIASHIHSNGLTKPVFAYIAGRTAPQEKRMGHAGAIVSAGRGNYESKAKALTLSGVKIAETPSQIVSLIKKNRSLKI